MKLSNERLHKVKEIAAEVRGDLVWEYYLNTVRDWKKIYDVKWCVNTALENDFCGWCARASARLFNALTAAGFNPRLHIAESDEGGHVFVTVRGYVVDITATQFDNELEDPEPVTILERDISKDYWFYNTTKTFKTVTDLQRYQKKVGWPDHQTVQGVDKKYAATV